MIDENEIARKLRDHPVPEAELARQRSWSVVEAAFRTEGATRRRTLPRRMAVVLASLAAAAAALGLVLTPAGATVSDWVRDAVGGSSGTPTRERAALAHVPSGGRLLVGTGSGQWMVAEDGSRRFLGSFADATWSPGGLFVAAADGDQLVAVTPDGELRWSVSAPAAVEDPVWAPGCCRIAYRSDGGLWAVDGSGNLNRRLAGSAAVAPSWRPAAYDLAMQESRNVIAFVDGSGRLRVLDVDSGQRLSRVRVGPQPTAIDWLDRKRILVAGDDRLEVVDVATGERRRIFATSGEAIRGVDAFPGAPSAAVLLDRRPATGKVETRLVLVGLQRLRPARPQTVFTGLGHYQGPLFSPDGSRVQLGWRDAGQWVFVPTARDARPIAVDDIPRRFATGGEPAEPLPRIESWCCR